MTVKPAYLDWETYSVVALPGISGSGKTSSARFILAQLALDGVGLVVCDPHGHLQRNNLAATIKPLSNAIIRPIAIEKKDILNHIRYVKDIMVDRYNKGEENGQKIVLVIDEVVSFLLDCTPQEVTEVAALFLKLANEARKTNIRVFLLSQNWKADYVGSKSIRNSINAILFHRISEEEVKLFFPSAPASLKRAITKLNTGEMIIRAAQFDFVKVTVPYISMDDLESISEFVPIVTPIRINTNNKLTTSNNPQQQRATTIATEELESVKNDESKDTVVIVRAKTLTEAVESIKLSKALGYSKTKTIELIFGIKPGTNKKYIAASKMYDTVINDEQKSTRKTVESTK